MAPNPAALAPNPAAQGTPPGGKPTAGVQQEPRLRLPLQAVPGDRDKDGDRAPPRVLLTAAST